MKKVEQCYEVFPSLSAVVVFNVKRQNRGRERELHSFFNNLSSPTPSVKGLIIYLETYIDTQYHAHRQLHFRFRSKKALDHQGSLFWKVLSFRK